MNFLRKDVVDNYIASKSETNLIKNISSEVTLFIAGDVMLGRTVVIKADELNDPAYPFRKVAGVMRDSDIVFFNLEAPFVDDCPRAESGYVFCADPSMLDGLVFAGVDVVNVANNHILNYGEDGLRQTIKNLDGSNILSTGYGNLAILEKSGITFGFLGFDKSQQEYPVLTQEEINLIKESDKQVDVLVIGMHWGVEYQDRALPGVRKLAKELVEDGADLIVGSHPHWVQDHEEINGVPVFYSLGNFVFDQMWSEKTKEGLAVKLVYDEDGDLKDYELLPTYMSSWSQPEFVKL